MKKSIVTVILLMGAAGFAQTSSDSAKTPPKPAKEGYHELAMPNFNGLDKKPAESDGIKVKAMTECRLANGRVVKEGDREFAACANGGGPTLSPTVGPNGLQPGVSVNLGH